MGAMGIDWIRKHCLSLPHTTEHVVWEDHLVFKVGGKMYAITSFEPAENWLAFKCTDEDFASLVEQPGVIPSPYLARAKWVSLQSESALRPAEVKRLLRQSYGLVFAKLPKKTRDALCKVTAGVPSRRKNLGG
jgi:predicted DNA-binding protein (MmcQ/YjbR family)